jgi:DNA uptake protein ComE-like DNA-binding protein
MQSPMRLGFVCWLVVCGLTSCNFGVNPNSDGQRQRDEKTREEAAKATERAKPEIEAAGRALGQAAQAAAEDVHAVAQGIEEGWKQGQAALDLNSASERQLSDLPGISQRDARKIIEHRPYRNKRDLVTKGVLSEAAYAKIREDVAVR